MRYGLLFLILALSLGGLGVVSGGGALGALWPALSVLVVALAYLGKRPGWIGKRADGTLALWSYPLLGPYLFFAWLIVLAGRLLGREDASNEIVPGLWVGRWPRATDLPPGAAHVLDLTAELSAAPAVRALPGYLCVPLLDGTPPDPAALRALVDRLREAPGLLVHCAYGHGRSATVAAALLLDRGHCADVEAAVALLKSRRPGVRLNAEQRAALAVIGPSRGPGAPGGG
ncbi:MAG: dual specificity protein phosphatase family protein [Byssovorax sp.]